MKKYIYGALIGLIAFTVVGGAVALANTSHGWWGDSSFSEGLAKLLGISADELKTQLQDNTLPQLLDEKGITHQQLYSLREDSRLQPEADILGMSLDDYKKELENGKTFNQLLDEKGITHVQLQEKMQEQMKERMTERLQNMVDNDTITEEQMQERLQNMEEFRAGDKGLGGCRGGMHMHGF